MSVTVRQILGLLQAAAPQELALSWDNVGLLVDAVSDILTVTDENIQPVPEVTTSFDKVYAEGIIAHENGMICFLNLARMFKERDMEDMAA